jgi:hypothetical protein
MNSPVPVSSTAGPGEPGGSNTAIPTLSEWAVIILSSLMALFGVAQVRRRNGAGL